MYYGVGLCYIMTLLAQINATVMKCLYALCINTMQFRFVKLFMYMTILTKTQSVFRQFAARKMISNDAADSERT
jgi:hypothetical protein